MPPGRLRRRANRENDPAMTPQQLSEAAQSLRDAARSGECIAPLRETYAEIDAAS